MRMLSSYPTGLLLYLLALLAGCAAPQHPAEPLPQRAPAEDVATTESPEGRAPAATLDPCAAFNASQANALSEAEHQARYGCPPCPCACSEGRVVCAPCAACEARPPPPPDTMAPAGDHPRGG